MRELKLSVVVLCLVFFCFFSMYLSVQDEDKLLKNMPKAKRRALLKKKQEKEDPRKQVVKNRMQIKGRTRSRMRVKM